MEMVLSLLKAQYAIAVRSEQVKYAEQLRSALVQLTPKDSLRQYGCTHCQQLNNASLWNKTTELDMGDGIMPIQEADEPFYRYTCPACNEVSPLEEIFVTKGEF